MSDTGDFREVVRGAAVAWWRARDDVRTLDDTIIDALAAAPRPLTAEFPCRRCDGDPDGRIAVDFDNPDGIFKRVPCPPTTTGMWLTEDALRRRLREAEVVRMFNGGEDDRGRLLPSEIDAIVRALFGGES